MSMRKQLPYTKNLNLLKVDPSKIHLSNVPIPEKFEGTGYEFYYLDGGKRYKLRFYLPTIEFKWGIQYGFAGDAKEGEPPKEPWERGYSLTIECPTNTMVFNEVTKKFEGSCDTNVDAIFNQFKAIEERIASLLDNTLNNSTGEKIVDSSADWKKRIIRYTKLEKRPNIPVKLSGQSVPKFENGQKVGGTWKCYTTIYQGKSTTKFYQISDLFRTEEDKRFHIGALIFFDLPSFTDGKKVVRCQTAIIKVHDFGDTRKPVDVPDTSDADDYKPRRRVQEEETEEIFNQMDVAKRHRAGQEADDGVDPSDDHGDHHTEEDEAVAAEFEAHSAAASTQVP